MTASERKLVSEIEDIADRVRDGGAPDNDEADLLEWALRTAAQVADAAYDDHGPVDAPYSFVLTRAPVGREEAFSVGAAPPVANIITMTPPPKKRKKRGQ